MVQQLQGAFQAAIYFVFPEVQAAHTARRQRERMTQLFQVNKQLRHRATGLIVMVREIDCGGAMLEAPTGALQRVDWTSPSGKIRGHVADDWDLVH